MRAFVGIGLPAACRDAIGAALAPLRAGRSRVAWTPDRNLHLTLKFLGEIDGGRVAGLAALMADAARDVPPFDLVAQGAGGFPSLRAPRVLWVGIREPLELVGKLQQNMETAFAGAGFPPEDRPFHPHVTVGRVRGVLPPGWGEAFRAAFAGARLRPVPVASYQLYESRLSPGGADYTVLHDVPFGGIAVDGQAREERDR